MHPADSRETHANKEAFQKLEFPCSRWARSSFSQAPTRTKQLRKNENSTTDFPQLFWPKTTSDDKDQKRKKSQAKDAAPILGKLQQTTDTPTYTVSRLPHSEPGHNKRDKLDNSKPLDKRQRMIQPLDT